jgi:hypothetical protein
MPRYQERLLILIHGAQVGLLAFKQLELVQNINWLLLILTSRCAFSSGLRAQQLHLLFAIANAAMFYYGFTFVSNTFNLTINSGVLILTVYLFMRYGECDFEGIVYHGPYAVGCRSFYCSKSGCPVSVYYPVDKALYEASGAQRKKWLDHNENDRWIK